MRRIGEGGHHCRTGAHCLRVMRIRIVDDQGGALPPPAHAAADDDVPSISTLPCQCSSACAIVAPAPGTTSPLLNRPDAIELR